MKNNNNIFFERIVLKTQKKMFNYILRQTSNREDTEDILQSVYTSVYKKIDNIDLDKIESYLYRSAHNAIVNYYKKRKNNHISYNDYHGVNSDKSVFIKDENNNNEKILTYLRTLSPSYKEIIELKYFQKKSYKEISSIIGKSTKAVESLLIRAKNKLRKKIEGKKK
jgi:RNA polymerase sigma-70 factor (ECF subfamily)